MILRPTHSRVIMPATITGRDSTARYSAMRGPTTHYIGIAEIAGGLWPRSNETFVPASEPLISIYVSPGVSLALRTGAGASSGKFSN